jgi:hypothetical protein
MALPADWYADPSGRYQYRYWDGYQWTNQVSSGGASAIDSNPLDATVANTPPAPGSQAAPIAPKQEPAQPAVQVSQSGGGMGFGVIMGVLIALIAVIFIVVILFSGSDDSSDTTEPPATTEAPATTAAP